MEPQQKRDATFILKECKCTSFSFTDFGLSNKSSFLDDGYEFKFDINARIAPETKKILHVVKLNLADKEQKRLIALLEAEFIFEIINFDELILRLPDGGFAFPSQLMTVFNGIIISTLRGMYAVKLENSIYSNAILPVIDPAALAPKVPPPAAVS